MAYKFGDKILQVGVIMMEVRNGPPANAPDAELLCNWARFWGRLESSVDRWNFAGNPGNTISLGGGKSNVLGIFTPKLGEDFQVHNFV